MSAAGINAVGSTLSDLAADGIFGDSEFGRGIGTVFSQGVTTATDTMANNIIKGTSLTQGLGKNVGSSVAGAGAGLAANYIGKGITSALGDSKLARGIGQGVATGLGAVGGQALGNLIKTGTASNTLTDSIKAIKTFKELNNTIGTSKEALGAAKAAKMRLLTFSDNPDETNAAKHGLFGIGTRYSWIKMDCTPSLEGLRQAFMMPERTVHFFENKLCPYSEPNLWIRKVTVQNTVLTKNGELFEVEFNPQLTTIIGGRGSGKSSILRFLRGVFGKDKDFPANVNFRITA